jgi:hypothetical protein
MRTFATLSVALLILGAPASSQDQPSTPENAALRLVQEIPLPDVEGRIDHFTSTQNAN